MLRSFFVQYYFTLVSVLSQPLQTSPSPIIPTAPLPSPLPCRAPLPSHPPIQLCSSPLFINMKLLKVKDIHKLSQLKFFYKRFHRELPEYFNTMLTKKPIDIHDHSTRKRDTFLTERIYHSFAEKCIRNSILHIVNGVPHAIKDKVSIHSFHGFSQ